MTEWQPIEAAPKDGTEIIVGYYEVTVWIVKCARYVKANQWCPPEDGDTDGWWSMYSCSGQEMLDGYSSPTHWIPLPELPAQ